MARSSADEISILRFFETEPIEKAELLLKIVAEKMRERLGRGRNDQARASSKDAGAARRRRVTPEGEAPTLQERESESAS